MWTNFHLGSIIEEIEHYLALSTVVCGFVLPPSMIAHLHPECLHVLKHQLALSQGPQEAVLDLFIEARIGDADVPGQVPRQVDHRDDGFELSQLVPLVTLDAEPVLFGCQWTDVPSNVVAPA